MERSKVVNIILGFICGVSFIVSCAIGTDYIRLPSFGLDTHCGKNNLNSAGCYNLFFIGIAGMIFFLLISIISGLILLWRLLLIKFKIPSFGWIIAIIVFFIFLGNDLFFAIFEYYPAIVFTSLRFIFLPIICLLHVGAIVTLYVQKRVTVFTLCSVFVTGAILFFSWKYPLPLFD